MGKRKQKTRLFEEILDEYQREVVKKTPKRILSPTEKKLNGMLIIITILFYAMIIYWQWRGNAHGVFWAVVIYISIIILIIALSQCLYMKARDKWKSIYKERLSRLRTMLIDSEIYTIEKMDMLIAWCDTYSQQDNEWVKEFRHLRSVIAVSIIPTAIWAFEELYSETEGLKMNLMILRIQLSLLIGMIIYIVVPTIKGVLNRKHSLAGKLKDDLIQLKFQK